MKRLTNGIATEVLKTNSYTILNNTIMGKKILLLITTILLVVSTSCSKDDDNFVLTAQYLSGTSWRGTMVKTNKEVVEKTYNVGVIFYSENKGLYDTPDWYEQFVEVEFNYSVEGRFFILSTDYLVDPLHGRWYFIEKRGNRMVFESSGTGADREKILTLERLH